MKKKTATVAELQEEIDLLTAQLKMVKKSLDHWANEALALTDENRKLLEIIAQLKNEKYAIRR